MSSRARYEAAPLTGTSGYEGDVYPTNTGPAVWDGLSVHAVDADWLSQINNQFQAIGTRTGSNGSVQGVLWESGTATPIWNLLPKGYQSQISWINPLSISNQARDGSIMILFQAGSQLDSTGANWGTQTFVWTRDTDFAPHLALANVPTPYLPIINNSGLIATLGTDDPYAGHALLLVPVSYHQVYPSSGFDWVSQPNWLMVPVSGSNQAIATTPASMSSNLTFSIQPPSSTTTVSSATLSSTSQLLTVHSTTVGETSAVTPGAGIATTGTISGLQLDVKPMKPITTVAIHAVTQHYTSPMVLLPGMAGTPGEVCVRGTSVLWTTPTSPDTYGSGGSLTIITGPTGVCHTLADSRDVQVIPVGQAIPGDIAPADTPSAADLHTYLNQVFGTQANVYFSVTRSDFAVDYDVNKDGTLDVILQQDHQSTGQQIIDAHKSSGVTFNLFYVKDFQGLAVSGTAPDRSNAGVAYFPHKLAYVLDENSPYIFQTSAHEIGHLLNLAHTDFPYLPSLVKNPASTDKIPDPSPTDRLMYGHPSPNLGFNTLLIKPEWDIINPNPPPQ